MRCLWCWDLCGVVCVVICCSVVWGVVIFGLYVMRVDGGAPLWVACVFRRVDVVCVSAVHPVAILSAMFCVICSLLTYVSDASGDQTAYSQHTSGGGLITLIRDNITFTTTDIPSTINTHNTELQMVKVHINNNNHITIANIYIPPRDSTSTHYKTVDTDIQHCIQYITNIPHSVLTGDGTHTLMTTDDN